MKLLIKKIIDSLVRNDWIWHSLNFRIIPLVEHAKLARRLRNEPSDFMKLINDIFSEKRVLHGVFSGMKYPEMSSTGSTLYPKLLGSYEKELESLFEKICNNQYSEIVDIGCAEGYYAVGLGMRIQNAKIFAFDTNIKATQQCIKMAKINNISERLIIGGFCDAETLKNLPFRERALIISDCEGYEKDLFNKDNVFALSCHEFLIEVHDLVDIETSSYLREIFEATHNIEVYSSIDDIKKAQTYSYKELEGLSLNMKWWILREGRGSVMEWFYMTPKLLKS